MSEQDALGEALALMIHSYEDVPGDWDDILARAGSRATRRRRVLRRRAFAFAISFAVVATVVVAAAFATGLADRFSAWLNGKPGIKAPSAVERAFTRRNAAAYASFPQGTRLRLLGSQTVAGKTFSLLGFQNGDAYCLRLIRTDLPGGTGENVCLRAAELDGTEAVVAGDARFQVGDPAINVDGVFGFAAHDVDTVEVGRLRSGPARARPANNVFLSLRGQPAGSGHHHPLPDPVTTVTVVTRAGSRLPVPYISEHAGRFPTSTPTVPSYFGRGSEATLGGPTKVAYKASDSIAWLNARQRRGLPFPRNARVLQRGTVEFGRVIQPDPASPERVGVLIFKPSRVFDRRAPTAPTLCLAQFEPLALQPDGLSCNPIIQATGAPPLPAIQLSKPLMIGGYIDSAVIDLTGLVSDRVASVTLYLSDGRAVKAALNDNVFSVSAPNADLPGKLVARDRNGRAVGISQVAGSAPVVVRPCPPAAIAKIAAPTGPLQPWQRVDLATLTVNGHSILGQSVSQVIAALGKPTHLVRGAQVENGVSIPELLYGGKLDNKGFISRGGSPTWQYQGGLVIGFIKHGAKIVANDLNYTTGALTDSRLGVLLRRQPSALQTAVKKAYGSKYTLRLAYGSDPGFGCTGTFVSNSSPRGFKFGLYPYLPTRPYLTIEANAAANQ